LTLCFGKCRKASQEVARPLHREPHSPAHSQIRLDILT
jgi:hypothetical protein